MQRSNSKQSDISLVSLRAVSRRVTFLRNFQRLNVNACVQENWFSIRDYEGILSKWFLLYLAGFDGRWKGFFLAG